MRLQDLDDLAVVVPVGQREDVPAVRRPLVGQPVAVELRVDHAANQRVVDAGVVVGEHDPQPLADLERQGLGLQLLRVPGAHGELALEGDDLRRIHWRADDVPERGLAGGERDADARWPAVDVVRDVGRLDVTRQRADASSLRLREERDGRRGRGPPAVVFSAPAPRRKPMRVDRQHARTSGAT